jgi:hypothetical protein
MDLVYIMAPSYSGSTLLTRLLASHPQIATVGELKANIPDMAQYVCSCGSRIDDCAFWKELAGALRQGGISLNGGGGLQTHFRAPDRWLLDRVLRARVRGSSFELLRAIALRALPGASVRRGAILEKNRALIGAVASQRAAQIFVDSSKEPVRLKYLAASPTWKVKAIHLIRDGRANAAAHMKHEGIGMQAAAVEWLRTHAECERVARLLLRRNAVQRLHYEQLCRDPREALDNVCRFLEVPPLASVDESGSNQAHLIGNRMRLVHPLKIVLDEKWRETLGRANLAAFQRIAGDMNRRYGYVDPPDLPPQRNANASS